MSAQIIPPSSDSTNASPPPLPQLVILFSILDYGFNCYLRYRESKRLNHSQPPDVLKPYLEICAGGVEIPQKSGTKEVVNGENKEVDEGDKEKKKKRTPLETFLDSQSYSLAKIRFRLISGAFALLFNCLLLYPFLPSNTISSLFSSSSFFSQTSSSTWSALQTKLGLSSTSSTIIKPIPFVTQLYLDLPSFIPSFIVRFFPTSMSGELERSLNFFFAIQIISLIFVELPTSIYQTFVLESQWGFNKTTPKLFIRDQLISILLTIIIGTPLISIALGFLRFIWGSDPSNQERWYLWVFGGLGLFLVFNLLAVILYPTVIMPLFNKFEPLDKDGELFPKVEKLAKRVGFPLGKVWVIDGSKRSSHSNAFFTGLPFLPKHVVVFDTLLNTQSHDEIVAVLAHEFGHYKHRHVLLHLLTATLQISLLLTLFAYFVQNPTLFHAFGFPPSSSYPSTLGSYYPYPMAVGLILTMDLFQPTDLIMVFLVNYFTRACEYDADKFAAKMKKNDDGDDDNGKLMAEDLKTALAGLHGANLAVTDTDSLYSAYTRSHPTLTERLSYIDQVTSKSK